MPSSNFQDKHLVKGECIKENVSRFFFYIKKKVST